MSVSNIQASEQASLSDRKLDHDLHAQLLNIKGFCGEVERSAIELETLRDREGFCQNTEISARLNLLINDDLLPCIKYLSVSADRLDDMIKAFRTSVVQGQKEL